MNRLADLKKNTSNRLAGLTRETSFRGAGATGGWEEPSKQISVWEPTIKERIKNVISGMVRRSPFIEPGKRLGQLGLHHLSEAVSGLGLYIPDVLANKITKEDTLVSAVDKITGFEPTPRDIGAGESAKFITSLHSVGRILGLAIAAIPARPALQIILGSGVSFGGRRANEELAKKISTGKPIDIEGIHFEGGIGVLFGAGTVGVSKFVNFVKNIRALPKAQIRPARAEVNAALKHYQKTGDRTKWDAVRIKYAGIKPEGVSKIQARQAPPKIKEFGKYPIARPIERPPTVGKLAPRKPVSGRKAEITPVTKPEAVEVAPEGKVKVYHGTVDMGDTVVLETGKKAGGDSGAVFFTESKKYAKQYLKEDSGLYETELDVSNVFDISNPQHIKKLLDGWYDPSEFDSKADAIKDAKMAVDSMKDTMQLGAVDWATGSQFLDKIERAGFEGVRFLERPGENIEQLPSGGFKISGPPVYSYAMLGDKYTATKAQPVTKAEPTKVVGKKAERIAIKLKDGTVHSGLLREYTSHADLAVKLGIDFEQIESSGFIDNKGKLKLDQDVGVIKGKIYTVPKPESIEEIMAAEEPTKVVGVLDNLAEKARKYKTADSFAKRIKLTKEEVRALREIGFVKKGERGLLPDLRRFWNDKLKAEPTKDISKFVHEAKAEELKTKAEMGIVEVEPSTGVPYWHTAANQGQKERILELAQKKAMISEKGKLKPQFRKITHIYTGEKTIDRLTEEQADTLISVLMKLPEPKMKAGKLIPPSIPRTTALVPKGFFQRKFKRPTPATLITANNYYAEKLGVHSLVEPLEKAKMRFDLEHQKASNELDRMGKTIDKIGKTTPRERLAAKRKNIPTRARTEMGNLLDSYEEAPANLSLEKKEIFNWHRNLRRTILIRQNEARAKLGLPLIKKRKAYQRHIATDVSRDMLAGKYPFPEGIGFWSGLNVGKKVFNPMEFQRKLEDDVYGLFTRDPIYADKAMMYNALKEIHLNQPLKFFNEQLNALGKDLPEYKNLSPRERNELDRTMVMPADTRRWLIDYVNTVIKGRQSMPDRLVNNIVNESGLKGLLNTALRPYGRVLSQRPITRFFQGAGRVQMAGVMGPRPRLLIRNKFQLTQNMALYGMKANIRAFLPPNKELKELLDKSLFLKSYTGLEELPAELSKKVEKLWHKAYQWTATSNARQAMEVAYWDIKELIENPKYKKYGWKPEHLLKEMEFGASATQYQYNAIGMPGIFRHKSFIPATRLTSWWMNYFAKFHREAFLQRFLKGRPSWSGPEGPTLPWSRRLGWLRYAVLGGFILNTMGYTRSYMFGAAPTGWPPALQAASSLYQYVIADDEKRRKAAKAKFYNSAKTFIPGYIAYKDYEAWFTGRKDWKSLFFYEKRKKKESDESFAPE